MPTVILLDVSLSMCRNLPLIDVNEGGDVSIRDVAVRGLTTLVDYISTNCKLEYTSLIAFSSLWEKLTSFTRDYELIKGTLNSLDTYYDKTNVINAISSVSEVVSEEWGTSCPLVNVILVTDGCLGINGGEIIQPTKPFLFPCKLHVVILGSKTDSSIRSSVTYFEKLIYTWGLTKVSTPSGTPVVKRMSLQQCDPQVHALDGMTLKSVKKIFSRIAESNYHPWKGTLHCGSLFSPVSLFPPLESQTSIGDFEATITRPTGDLKIVGFMGIEDVASPPVLSRHLVLAAPMTREQLLAQPSVSNVLDLFTDGNGSHDSEIDAMLAEDGKQPSLCVLLHGSLKVEGMVAVTEIGPDWFGILYSWADSKKKFNLMLSTFGGKSDCVPWLGKLKNLGNPDITPKLPQGQLDRMKGKKSYHSQNSPVVWIGSSGLQSDVQKICRLAKRLPEKVSNFYKELSRFRKAAASFGFFEILGGLATILEREIILAGMGTGGSGKGSGGINPEALPHLQYAISVLRSNEAFGADIPPLK